MHAQRAIQPALGCRVERSDFCCLYQPSREQMEGLPLSAVDELSDGLRAPHGAVKVILRDQSGFAHVDFSCYD